MIPGASGSEITKIPPMDEVLRRHTIIQCDICDHLPRAGGQQRLGDFL
jgi:hypothetical protein